MLKREPKLSDSEWLLMKICWKKGVCSVKNVHEEYKKQNKVSYVTTKTMLDRLVEKDFLKREKFGPIWLYTATVSEKSTVSNAVEKFVNVVLDGNVLPVFMQLFKNKEKYAVDIENIKKIIEENKIED